MARIGFTIKPLGQQGKGQGDRRLRPLMVLALSGLISWLPATAGQTSPPGINPLPPTTNLPQALPRSKADIIIHPPIIWPYPPTIRAPRRQIRVQFVAEGTDWGSVYLNQRLIYQPHNFNRRREFELDEGAYYLEVTGVARTDIWDSGYLDVGRDNANILIVVFSKTGGVRVIGADNAWISDSSY